MIDAHLHLFEQVMSQSSKGQGRLLEDNVLSLDNGDRIRLVPSGRDHSGFTAEDALMLSKEASVDSFILMQSGFYGYQNQYYEETAKKYPGKFYPAASFDPYMAGRTNLIRKFCDSGVFKLFKFELSSEYGLSGIHPEIRIDNKYFAEIFEAAEDKGLSVALDIGLPGDPCFNAAALKKVIDCYPKLHFVICHLMMPHRDRNEWINDLKTVQSDNLWFDIAAIQYNIPEYNKKEGAAGYYRTGVEIAGEDRLMWGSDGPGILNLRAFKDQSRELDETGFSPETLKKIKEDNAKICYRI